MSATQEEIAVERLQEWIRELLIVGRDASTRIRLPTLRGACPTGGRERQRGNRESFRDGRRLQ